MPLSLDFIKEALFSLRTESVSSLEDSTVTLSYTYSKQADGSDNFFWYRQYPGKPPEFLIFHLGTQNDTNNRLSVKVSEDKTRMHLQISSAAVTDSAVYYCAVRPTVTGNTKTLESHTMNHYSLSQCHWTDDKYNKTSTNKDSTQSCCDNRQKWIEKDNLSTSHVNISQQQIMLDFTGTDIILTFRLLSLYSGKEQSQTEIMNIFLILDISLKHQIHQLH
uniref:Ig-like domain-containing protein n=1 Tax=Sparus aurata TaxID=8175 RepID=A0A671WGP3_SPAAU